MPALTPEQVRSVYDDAYAFEVARRSTGQTLLVAADPATIREIEQVALEAVARAQLMVAAPATNEHPLFRRMARQARQLNHLQNTMSESAQSKVGAVVDSMYSSTVMLCELGVRPAEKWAVFADSIIEANVELVAQIVSNGLGTLPPAANDHD